MAESRVFIDRCHEALTQQSRGYSEPLLELWSRADDVTVMAAIGSYHVGFDAVSDLLSTASKTQSFDSWSAENLVTYVVESCVQRRTGALRSAGRRRRPVDDIAPPRRSIDARTDGGESSADTVTFFRRSRRNGDHL
jgi:hypothetical protein